MRKYWAIPVLTSVLILGALTLFSEPAYSSDAGGSLVVHYDFEDGTFPTTSDVSGHGNDGTLVGGATYSPDVPPLPGNFKSLDLTASGTDDYLIKNPVAAAPTPFPSGDITTTFWMKSSDSGIPAFVSYATNAVGTSFNDWVIQNVNSEFEACPNNGCVLTNTAPTILDGLWHHIAASWRSSDGKLKLYNDGVLIRTVPNKMTGTSIAGIGSLVLGQEQDSVGGGFSVSEAFEGLLDDVRIYDRVLSDEEIEELFDPIIEVDIDIKPTSCPNPLNIKSKGVLPVAILGSAELDVTDINVSTILFEGVPPIRSEIEDVATPFGGVLVDELSCTTDGVDGFDDLTLKFDKQAIIAEIGAVDDGVIVTLTLDGELFDGTALSGQDNIIIKKKGN